MDTHEQIVAATRYAPTDEVDVTCVGGARLTLHWGWTSLSAGDARYVDVTCSHDVNCSHRRPRLIVPHAVGPHALARGRHTLYGRVPVEVVARVIDRLGGIRRIKPHA